jgi:hypothetical protein
MEQNSAATSIVKFSYFLNRLADRVIGVIVRKLVELPKFFVFNSRTNSFWNSSVFAFYLLLFALYSVLYLLLSFCYGVSDNFVSAFFRSS